MVDVGGVFVMWLFEWMLKELFGKKYVNLQNVFKVYFGMLCYIYFIFVF